MRRLPPLLIALLAAGCAGPTKPQGAGPLLQLTPCHLTTADVPSALPAKCGVLSVPLDRDSRGGETIELRVAVYPAVAHSPRPDPIFILAGGPGQAATEAFVSFAEPWSHMHIARDIVLVDQRGTGGSHPLTCAEEDAGELDDDLDAGARRAHDCAVAIGPAARFYGTDAFADDLDEVRAALGYDAINVYGGSYGTEAALVYGHRHPVHVRAMVLDGVMSQTSPHSETTARDADAVLRALFSECASDESCHGAFPDPEKDLETLLERLRVPEAFTTIHPRTGRPLRVRMTRELLGDALLALSYESETSTMLPMLLHNAAVTGDMSPIVRALAIVSSDTGVSAALHLAVICAEQAPRLDLARASALAAGTYLGDFQVRSYIEKCKDWPKRPLPLDALPSKLDAPVLLLSGLLDPVTPPSNAEEVRRLLPHAFALTVRGHGHGTLSRGCVRRIVETFLERRSVENLDTSCLDEMHDVRFFTSFAGPSP